MKDTHSACRNYTPVVRKSHHRRRSPATIGPGSPSVGFQNCGAQANVDF